MTALERAESALRVEVERQVQANGSYSGPANGSPNYVDTELDYESLVRAVLMAVRELPDKILNEHLHDNEYGYSMYYEGWQPAIDAILNEKA